MVFDQHKISTIFLSLSNPYEIDELSSIDIDVALEHFLKRFFLSNPTENYIKSYFHILNFVNFDKFRSISLHFLFSLTDQQVIQIIQNLPISSVTFFYLMKQLLNKTTFFLSFNRLFTEFTLIPKDLIPFFNYCFRFSLKNKILIGGINVMIASVLSSDQYEAIDFFFSAIMEDQSILASYIGISDTFSLLDFETKSTKLPISYLKFLLFIDNQANLTESQILSLFVKSPLLTLEFIERFPINKLDKIWSTVLNNLFSIQICEMDSQTFDSQLNIFYCFLQSSLMHLNSLTLISSKLIHRILENSVKFSDKIWPIFLILLIFARIDNLVSLELSKSVEFSQILKKNIFDSNEKFAVLQNYFFWVLNPTSSFPIKEIMPLHAKYVFQNLPLPSPAFSKEIASQFVSFLLIKSFSSDLNESEFNNFISDLVEKSQDNNIQNNYFLGYLNEEALKLLVSHSMTNSQCFELLCNCLSLSCNFTAFSMVYNLYGEDHKKFLHFLTLLSTKTPIVNDFVRINSKNQIKLKFIEKSILMWIRIIKQNSTIATFLFGNDTSVTIKYQMNTFIFDVNQKKIKFLTSDSNIDGWYFICINFSNNSMNAFVNLDQISIQNYFREPILMTIGDENSAFDLQSVRVFHSVLYENQIKYLFFLGPNFKKTILDNLSSLKLKDKCFLFAAGEGYLSSIYVKWFTHAKNIKGVHFSKNSRLEFEISPPFNSIENFSSMNEINLSGNRFHFHSFFNSLEAFGGFSLLIHIFAEVILREKDLHEIVFNLIFILLNRFPFVHHYFTKNKFYQIISQLLKKTTEKVDFKMILKCAMMNVDDNSTSTFSNILILNSNVMKNWLFSTSIFDQNTYEIIEKICESLQSKYEEYNLNIIVNSPIFSFISNSFLNAKEHSSKLFELLISLRLKITTKENVKENINTILQCLLEYHFSSKSIEESENLTKNKNFNEKVEQSEIFLLHLLIQILIKFPDSINNSTLEDLLPLLTCATVKVKSIIFDILMKYLNSKYYSDFISALQYSNDDRNFLEQIFHISFKFINVSENMKIENFHYITIPLLCFIYHIEIAEDLLISFCTGLNGAFKSIPKYPEMMLIHMYDSLCILKEKPEMIKKHLEPKFENSFIRIPQLLLMYVTFIWIGVFKTNDQFQYNIKTFLLDLSKVDYGNYLIFILSSSIDKLRENIKINADAVCKFVDFCFNYLNLIIQLRKENLGQNSPPPPNIHPFIISSIQIVNSLYMKYKIKELINRFILLISEIQSNYSEVYSTFVNDLKECKFPLKITKTFNNNNDNIIVRYKEYLSSNINKKVQKDEFGHERKLQTFYDKKMIDKQISNEGIIKSWKSIFNDIHFPGSLIHKNYPEKYKIDVFSKKYQIHRILFPTNPAYETIYIDNWSEKYSEQPPNIKLTINDVVHDVGISHSENSLFSEKILFLYGVKAIEGHFSMNEKRLHFLFPSKLDEMIFNLNGISRIILNEYQHQMSGFSIEDKSDNLYSFSFENVSTLSNFVDKTKKLFAKKNIKFINRFDVNELGSKTRDWENGIMSNFEYLVNLNFISGRSWSDYTRYPIFPWVFSRLIEKNNESTEENETNKSESNNEEEKSKESESTSATITTSKIESNDEEVKNKESESTNETIITSKIEPTNDEEKSKESESTSATIITSKIESNDEEVKSKESESTNATIITSKIESNDEEESESNNETKINNESESTNKNNTSIETEHENTSNSEAYKKLDDDTTSTEFEINTTNGTQSEPEIRKSTENEEGQMKNNDSEMNLKTKIKDQKHNSNPTSKGSPPSSHRIIGRASSSPLYSPNKSDDDLNQNSESSISTIELSKESDNTLLISTESFDISEFDASATSASEGVKINQSSLLQFPQSSNLKSIKSSPQKAARFSLKPIQQPSMLTPHSSSSAENQMKLARSTSDFVSDSSYKLDISSTKYAQYQKDMNELNKRKSFRIKTFDDVFTIDSRDQYQIRNLCLPFFAQTEKQQQSCTRYYKLTKRIENDPHHYSSYLSNISSALYFLVRLEPSTTFEIDHQDGKLDAADRTFQSLELTLQVMSNPDSRSAIELIPEFFFMPEIFMNVNKIKFPHSPIHDRIIDDVIIPKWAKNQFKYVRFLRNLLESEDDSRTLNVWIDMVWGLLREGKNALNYFNTFQKIVFKFNPDQYSNNPKLLKAFRTQIINCGQAPLKLFGCRHNLKLFQTKKRKLEKICFNEALVDYPEIEDQKVNIRSFLPFIEDDNVSIIVQKNIEFVFAHKNVPIVSYWNIYDNEPNSDSKSHFLICFRSLMHGNLTEITALDLSSNKFIVAGHIDGKLSTFCLSSNIHFLRVIECPLNFSVSLVKVMDDNSFIITFQNYSNLNNKMDSCLISLFSINGVLIEKLDINDHVIDCTLSSFFDGIQTNYAFILTKKGTIIALSMNSLKIKLKLETERDDLISLHLKDNFLLSVMTNSNITFSWRLF